MPIPGGPWTSTDWSAPQAQRRPVELRTWVAAPALALISALFMPCTTTYFGPVYAAPRPVDLATWTRGPNPVAPGPPAIRQTDFPLPGRQPRPTDLQTWTQSPKPAAPGPPVIRQTDWPVPAAKPRPTDLGTWTQGPPSVVTPFTTNEWGRPRGPPRSLDLGTWTQGPTPPPVVAPFANYDLAVPQKAKRPTDLLTWLQGLKANLQVAPLLMPSTVLSWDVPIGVPRPTDLQTWTGSPTQTAVTYIFREPLVARPPAIRAANTALDSWVGGFRIQDQPASSGPPPTNYDWPIPQKASRPTDLRTWLQGFQANLQGTTPPLLMPSMVVGWDVPQQRAQPPGTWVQTPQPSTPIFGTPVANYDFTVPHAAKADLGTWVGGFRIQDQPPSAGPPPTIYDWPIPQKARRPSDLQTWAQGFQTNLQGTVLPLLMPSMVVGWEVPQAALPIFDQRTWINPFNIEIQASVSPVTPPSIGGGSGRHGAGGGKHTGKGGGKRWKPGFSETWLDNDARRKRLELGQDDADLDTISRALLERIAPPPAKPPTELKAYENFDAVLGSQQPISLSDAQMIALRARLLMEAAEEAERLRLDDEEAAILLLLS